MSGFILIDKPAGITSFDVVAKLRRLTGEKRIGHAGTLDPFATGLLLVAICREATRELQKFVGLDKTDEATFVLGASSTTDDVTGELSAPVSTDHITNEHIRDVLQTFVGEINQVPPTYAAIKVGGKKLYELARAGKPTLVEPRRITIYSIESQLSLRAERSNLPGEVESAGKIASSSMTPPRNDNFTRISIRIHCSSGTYIRSIARDLGQKLGVGGYVETLRRSTIGPFSIQEAVKLSELTAENVSEHIQKSETFLRRLT